MKKLVCAALVCLLLISLTACSAMADDSQIRTAGVQMLDALLADDFEGSYAIVSQVCSVEEYTEVYSQFRSILSGINSYELQLLQLNRNVSNEGTVTQAIYRIRSEGKPLLLSIATNSEVSGLISFHLSVDNETTVSYNGDLTNMRDASVPQWCVLALALVTSAFVLWMVVDCCRRKPKRWGLWLLLILLGCLLISGSFQATSFNIRFNVGIFLTHSALLRYTDGSTVLRLLVPLGAIVYYAQRKKLSSVKAAAEETPPAEQPEESVIPPTETDE